MKIAKEISLAKIKEMAAASSLLRYAMHTCWWGMEDAPWYKTSPTGGLPCDPRGSVLMQTEKPLDFIAQAEANPSHYGKYGLRTFLLSYHGCVTTDDGRPTSLEKWAQYEALIDSLSEVKP